MFHCGDMVRGGLLMGLEFLESGPKVSPQVTPHIITGRRSSRNYVVPGAPVISIITRPVLPSVLSTRPPPALLFPVLPVMPVIFAFLYFPSQNFNSWSFSRLTIISLLLTVINRAQHLY